MYERILVATDASPAARRAAEYGLGLGAELDAALETLYVVDSRIEELAGSDGAEAILETSEKAGRQALAELEEREPDLEIHREVRYGVPYEEILDHADDQDVDLVVVGTSGTSEERLGSTAERVVTFASVPVLVVPGTDAAIEPPSLESVGDVLVPLDGSDAADRAAERALEFAERFGATAHALYVVDSTVYDLQDAPRSIVGTLRKGGERTVEEFTERAESIQVRTTGTVGRGRPADEILAKADGVDADLVVMGTRGRGGLPEHLLGSTTRRVLRESDRPVLSVD